MGRLRPSTFNPSPPSLSEYNISGIYVLQKREQERQLDELKTKMEACTLGLSTVESETELVTGKMEEMKVAPEH